MNRIRRFFAPIEARHVILAAVCFSVSFAGIFAAVWLALKTGGCL